MPAEVRPTAGRYRDGMSLDMTTADGLDGPGAYLVEVFAPEKRCAPARLFVALMPRSAALTAVRSCIPGDHQAVLSRCVLNSDQVSALGLRSGQVREIDVEAARKRGAKTRP